MTQTIDDIPSTARGVFLHAGMPKTGTSALQRLFYTNRKHLRRHGVIYDPRVVSADLPVHKWMHKTYLGKRPSLDKQNWQRFAGHDRILLSTEQIGNHLGLASKAGARTITRELREFGPLHIILAWRETQSWQRSRYKQLVANPPSPLNPLAATALTFDDVARHPATRFLSDQKQVVARLEDYFQAPVYLAPYPETGPEKIFEKMAGIPPSNRRALSRSTNLSITDTEAEFLRLLNAIIPDLETRRALARVWKQAGLSEKPTLNRQAEGAKANAIEALDVALLDTLQPKANDPLKIDPDEFETIRQRMIEALLSLQS